MAKVLIIEDDVSLCRLISDCLAGEHHITEVVHDGNEAIQRLKVYGYDLIILDWELPNASGMEILRDFRNRGGNTPVLFLTGRDAIADKEQGLDSGADDYLTKPFSTRELIARIKALLRRAPSTFIGDILKVGEFSLDRSNYVVTKHDVEIKLLPKEFALLEFFMRNPNRVFAQEALLNRVWPNESEATIDALTTCLGRLRKKIDEPGEPSLIRTVHGVGYKLECAKKDQNRT